MIEFITKFFRREEASKNLAKERLRLVLMSDRVSLAPDIFETMKVEMLDVIRRYLEVDERALEMRFENAERQFLLLANIPVRSVLPLPRKTTGAGQTAGRNTNGRANGSAISSGDASPPAASASADASAPAEGPHPLPAFGGSAPGPGDDLSSSKELRPAANDAAGSAAAAGPHQTAKLPATVKRRRRRRKKVDAPVVDTAAPSAFGDVAEGPRPPGGS
ncbi:MAG: cell division topological specificity factor MinE [Candidatus Eremiobacteraeota bacterium]|nr:cell division topological specificity factor MinE [Candidatus Eremiobacteraeota bacterium]MBC5827914.1 cell division topological specificity factor MinE [Candidatus Eremiobacteraeota bacterium]